MPEPTQLAPLKWRGAATQHWAPPPTSKGESGHPTQETHVSCLYRLAHSFGQHQQTMTTGEGHNMKWQGDWDSCLWTQLFTTEWYRVCYCNCWTNLTAPFFPYEQDLETFKLLFRQRLVSDLNYWESGLVQCPKAWMEAGLFLWDLLASLCVHHSWFKHHVWSCSEMLETCIQGDLKVPCYKGRILRTTSTLQTSEP